MTDYELCMRSERCRNEAVAEAVAEMAARRAEKKAELKKEAEPVRKSDKSDAEKLRGVIKPRTR